MEILVKTDGRPTLAIVTVITGCLTNCVLDYVAIFLLDWGAWGAAFATGLSQLLTCVIYLTHFLGKRTTFHLVRFRPDWHIYRRLLPIGVSDGVTELCNGVMIFLFNRTILRCIGQDGLVSYTIIAYINTLILNIMLGCPRVPAPGQLSLRPEGPGRLPPSAALWPGDPGGYDRSVLRRGAAAGAPDRPRLPGDENPALNLSSVDALRRYGLCYLMVGFNVLMGGFRRRWSGPARPSASPWAGGWRCRPQPCCCWRRYGAAVSSGSRR